MTNNARISPQQVVDLANKLVNSFAYDEVISMVMKLGFYESELPTCDKPTEKSKILAIVEYLNKNRKIHDLLGEIIREKPNLEEFKNLPVKKLDEESLPDTSRELSHERSINPNISLIKTPIWWVKEAGSILRRVCRLEFHAREGPYTGTGFLVGADLILTNYHLVKSFIDGIDTIDRIKVRFDYFIDEDKLTPLPGKEYRLLSKYWLIDYSGDSEFDHQVDPPEVHRKDELDYALLCVKGFPGNEDLGISRPLARGWISIPEKVNNLRAESPLYIVQHPDGDPLQIAPDTSSVISVNKNITRVRYKTNTNFGSSGSPCFNQGWELVALHQSGDPNYEKNHTPQYNQGIPISAIRELLDLRGILGYLGRSEPCLLGIFEKRIPLAYPYFKRLYEEILSSDHFQNLDEFLDWLEAFLPSPEQKGNDVKNRPWLSIVIDKHIELFDKDIIGNIIKIRKTISKKITNLGEIEMTEIDFAGIEDIVPYQFMVLMFKETALLLSMNSSLLTDFKSRCRKIRSNDPLIDDTLEQLKLLRDQVERTFGYYQIYEFSNEYILQKLESFELKFVYEQLTNSITNLNEQINTVNTDLRLDRQGTIKKLESLYRDVINYSRKYAKCLYNTIQLPA